MNTPETRIFLRPIGSPLTVGMAGLTVASLLQSGLDLRWISTNQTHAVGLILLAVPMILQLLACIFSYLARDGATGAAVGVLATTWGGLGAVHLISTPGSRSGAVGLLLLSAGMVLAFTSIVVASAKPLPGTVFLLASVRFFLSGIDQLGGASFWRDAAGIVGLVVLGLAAYCVLAFEFEGQRGHAVLPTFRRRSAAASLNGSFPASLGEVEREPGVRQTT
jgi:succinate-acetate transporter protein